MLLASDLVFDAVTEQREGFHLTLSSDGSDLQLVDTLTKSVVKTQPIADNSGKVIITGSDQSESLVIDTSASHLSVTYNGGIGFDTLIGPAITSLWTISGDNAGLVNDLVTFSGVENLTGAVDNEDTFVVAEGGRVSGEVEGGDGGFDSVVVSGDYSNVGYVATSFDSGVITLDGNTLVFDGMEPVVLDGSVGTYTHTATASDDVITISPDAQGRVQVNDGVGETVSIENANTLVVVGGDGNDSVTVSGALDFSFGSLTIYAELVTVESNAQITNIADVTLTALADDGSGTLSAAILVDGDINATGQVTISAQVDNTITRSGNSTNILEATTSSARALIRSGAIINADSLSLTAYTNVDISVATVTDAISASLEVSSAQITHAGISGDVTLNVGSAEIDMVPGAPSLLVEAIDSSEIETVITHSALGALVDQTLNSGFDAYLSDITLSRDTQAYIGDTTGAVSINSPMTAPPTGLVRVHAHNRNGGNTGINGKVDSFLFGQHTNTVTTDNVLAFIAGRSKAEPVALGAEAVEVTAENSASYSVDAKVSANKLTGSTKSYISFADIGTASVPANSVTLLAYDSSSYTAVSDDFQANLSKFPSIEFGKASAINEINKPTQAYITASDVEVANGAVSVAATNNMLIIAFAY